MNKIEIPIQNVYYLLCYAWNKLEEKDIVDISRIETTQLCDFFAKILIGGTSRLLKMGLDRGYIQQNEEIKAIKGKLDFGLSLKKNLFRKARAQCQFDDLSYNVLHNQILKSTLWYLSEVDELNSHLKRQLNKLYHKFHEVDKISVKKNQFHHIQLSRNNSFYEFLLNICELIIDNLLPSEQKGHSKFMDFIRDEKKMANLFEKFIYNFYYLEQDQYQVKSEYIEWKISNEEDKNFLPKMKTDISLKSKDRKIIIDTKYYKEAMTVHFGKEIFSSQNISQMFSYLKNLDPKEEINQKCIGILLYPTVTKEIDHNFTFQGHKIYFKTINLNQDWEKIHDYLLKIVGLNIAAA